jgi:hypothetical protein
MSEEKRYSKLANVSEQLKKHIEDIKTLPKEVEMRSAVSHPSSSSASRKPVFKAGQSD